MPKEIRFQMQPVQVHVAVEGTVGLHIGDLGNREFIAWLAFVGLAILYRAKGARQFQMRGVVEILHAKHERGMLLEQCAQFPEPSRRNEVCQGQSRHFHAEVPVEGDRLQVGHRGMLTSPPWP